MDSPSSVSSRRRRLRQQREARMATTGRQDQAAAAAATTSTSNTTNTTATSPSVRKRRSRERGGARANRERLSDAHRGTNTTAPKRPRRDHDTDSDTAAPAPSERKEKRRALRKLLREFQLSEDPDQLRQQLRESQDSNERMQGEFKRLQAEQKKSNQSARRLKEQISLAKVTAQEQKDLITKLQSEGSLFSDVMGNFRELLETQLACSVCGEVFVQPTTIPCGHTFCTDCLTRWGKKNKTCPICRAKVKHGGAKPNSVLCEYIDKVVEGFYKEGAKTARQVLLDDRKRAAEEEATRAPLTDSGDDDSDSDDDDDDDRFSNNSQRSLPGSSSPIVFSSGDSISSIEDDDAGSSPERDYNGGGIRLQINFGHASEDGSEAEEDEDGDSIDGRYEGYVSSGDEDAGQVNGVEEEEGSEDNSEEPSEEEAEQGTSENECY